jgi:hypothetical protein
MGNSCRSSAEKYEGMRLYPIPRLLRRDNIRIDLKEVGVRLSNRPTHFITGPSGELL